MGARTDDRYLCPCPPPAAECRQCCLRERDVAKQAVHAVPSAVMRPQTCGLSSTSGPRGLARAGPPKPAVLQQGQGWNRIREELGNESRRVASEKISLVYSSKKRRRILGSLFNCNRFGRNAELHDVSTQLLRPLVCSRQHPTVPIENRAAVSPQVTQHDRNKLNKLRMVSNNLLPPAKSLNTKQNLHRGHEEAFEPSQKTMPCARQCSTLPCSSSVFAQAPLRAFRASQIISVPMDLVSISVNQNAVRPPTPAETTMALNTMAVHRTDGDLTQNLPRDQQPALIAASLSGLSRRVRPSIVSWGPKYRTSLLITPGTVPWKVNADLVQASACLPQNMTVVSLLSVLFLNRLAPNLAVHVAE